MSWHYIKIRKKKWCHSNYIYWIRVLNNNHFFNFFVYTFCILGYGLKLLVGLDPLLLVLDY
jgi:hypothetical protein